MTTDRHHGDGGVSDGEGEAADGIPHGAGCRVLLAWAMGLGAGALTMVMLPC